MTGVRWFTVTRGVAEVTQIVAAVVLARLIAPDEFGRLAVAVVVSEFAMMVANETIGTPLVQRSELSRAHLEAASAAGVAIGLGMMLVTLLVAPLLAKPLFGARTAELFVLFAPAFAIAGLQIVPLARLQRGLRFSRIGIVEVIGVLVASGVAVALAAAGLGARAYVFGVLAGLIASTAGYFAGAPPVMPRWRARELRELLGFGLPATAAGFAGVWYRNIDYLILGARLPATIVGYYYRAFTIGVEYERRLSGIVARVAFPVYARTDDPSRRLALRHRIVRLNVAIVYPMLTLFIAVAPPLVPWLFGQRWSAAVVPAQILAVAGMFSCVRNLTSPSVLAAGRPRALFVFSLVETVLYGVTVWAASSHGLAVVCLAVSGFQLTSLVLAYVLLLHSAVGIARTQLLRDLGPTLAACVPLLVVVLALRNALGPAFPVPALLALATLSGAATYVTSLRVLSRGAFDDVALVIGPLLARIPRPGLRGPAARDRANPAGGTQSADASAASSSAP
ncbi:MAG: oligosaccharide flippase family protein [Solirubrobacteraceae bacterium]